MFDSHESWLFPLLLSTCCDKIKNSDGVPLDRGNVFVFWLNLKGYLSFGHIEPKLQYAFLDKYFEHFRT